MSPVPELVRRQRALEQTMAKFRGRPFDWRGADCLTMLRFHLVKLGHKSLPKIPPYRDALGARRALEKAGFGSMEALLDSLLPRIAPARALAADVMLMGSDGEPLDAVVISVGQKVFGFHEDAVGAVVITPAAIKGAWRA